MPVPDVVVVGGGGHVGLPLSLRLADAGMGVGIFDVNQAVLDTIAAGRMPFLEPGADELLASVLPTGRLVLAMPPAWWLMGKQSLMVAEVPR